MGVKYTHPRQNQYEIMRFVTYIRSYFLDLLGFINGTEHFEENSGDLVSLRKLGSRKEGKIVQMRNRENIQKYDIIILL